MWKVIREDELYHHGIKGQKWGVRRFQNPYGTRTSAGKKQYMEANPNDSAVTKRVKADWNNLSDSEFRKKYQTTKKVYEKRVKKYGDPYMRSPLAKMGKKISGVNKYEKKSGKRLEPPEQVEAVGRHRARQFAILGQSFLQQQQQNMLFQQQIQQNQAMNNLAEIGRQNMMLTQSAGVVATNPMSF